MESNIALKVPVGHYVAERIKNVSLWEAESILVTKKQRYYTYAVRNGDRVELTSKYLVCPYCRTEFSANTHVVKGFGKYAGNRRVPKNKVREWASRQISFFDSTGDNILSISRDISNLEIFECPRCELNSKFSEATRSVVIERKKKKITIRAELASMSEFMSLQWLGDVTFSVCPPMYESLVFDLGKGRVYVFLEDNQSNVVSIKDITSEPEILIGDAAGNLICLNKKVNRTIKRMFEDIWQMPLPYKSSEITLQNLFKMTLFVGYKKEFYSYIPFCENSFAVYDSFENVAKRMHNCGNLPGEFEKSSLPHTKSPKKIFFSNPGLFFYIHEAEKLWSIIGDINLFCRILELDSVYGILSQMHMYPCIFTYMNDYCKIKGHHALSKNIAENWIVLKHNAFHYCTVCESVRNSIRKSWKKNGNLCHSDEKNYHYSVPMTCPQKQIEDCTIDGYDFFWLRNSNDYELASQKLENCLASRTIDDLPVLCVKRKNTYVAAIEMNDGQIETMLGYRNREIEENSELYSVIEKWKNRYGLNFSDFYNI